MSDQVKALFDQLVAEGADRAAIQKAFIIDLDLDPSTAISTYNKLARDSGLILSNEEKKARADAVFADADLSTVEGVEAAVNALVEAIDIAPSTATERVRVYCKEQGVTFPSAGGARESVASKEDVVAFLVANRGAERKAISEGLQELGYKKSTADSFIAMIPYLEEYAKQIG